MKGSRAQFFLLLPWVLLLFFAVGSLCCCLASAKDPLDLSRFPGLDKLTLPSSIRSIAWLQRSRVTHLDVSRTQVTTLKDLPRRLKALRARGLILPRLDLSKRSLESLDLRDTKIGKAIVLPSTLTNLSVEGDLFPQIFPLPKDLQRLTVIRAPLETFKLVPRGVQVLTLDAPSGSAWEPNFPASLRCLVIKNDSLASLPDLPLSTVKLSITRTDLTYGTLATKAPARLDSLRLHGARATNWEDLAATLINLDLLGGTYPNVLMSRLQSLRLVADEGKPLFSKKWPLATKKLVLENFTEGVIPTLPETIETLELPGTELVQLGDFLKDKKSIKALSLENWDTVDLALIPPSVEILNLSGVKNIVNLGKWPANLQVLICERCRHRDLLLSLTSTKVISIDVDDSRGITEVPVLPSLRRLSARQSDIRNIEKGTLAQLIGLDLCGSDVNDLRDVSPNLKSLAVTPDQLQSVPRLLQLDSLMVRERSECIDTTYSAWEEGRDDFFAECGQ